MTESPHLPETPPGRGYLPAPFWAILAVPFGLSVGYAQIAMPFALRARGADMTTIGAISFITGVPMWLRFFWAPALDVGWGRKSWFCAMILLAAVCLALTALIAPSSTEHLGPFTLLTVYTVLLTASQAAVATSGSVMLALMAQTLPVAVKGRASGWQVAGNLGGTFAGGALITWCLNHLAPATTAGILALLCSACILPALFIVEPLSPKRHLGRLMLALLKDVWASVRAREGWTALVICVSPVGTGALLNLVSALAHDYAPDDPTREHLAEVVTGVLSGIVQAVGALIGGYVCDVMNRRFAYVLFGGVTALIAVGMMLAPASPMAFTVGCLAYSFANGLCYAAFYAFILEMIGGGAGLTTKLALFVGSSNLPISYVAWLDGAAYDWAVKWTGRPTAGRLGMCGMDAAASFVGIAVLVAMIVMVRRWPVRPAEASVVPA